MKSIEEVLFEKCQDRELPTEQEIADAIYDEEAELLPNYYSHDGMSSARITRGTAISLLYR